MTNALEAIMELLKRLGDIPLSRILLQPPPGAAKKKDVIEAEAKTGRLCELVDGCLWKRR